ncbi:hypothetical protein MPDQ_001469 [Monascus purpureus]|uniref:NAD-dependent epimerase/dehydratase domain-containing protein n=1 Tax=Monascus purpureus TaxID=5098 RepID=A0A507R0I2_MONPU|nr:hypothetical protein MPDQ_001469 [Monascus purpureus]
MPVTESAAPFDASRQPTLSARPFPMKRFGGVDGVVHTAGPFKIDVEDNERDLIRPVLEGTRNILEAIEKNAPTVKRVVLTSSFASMFDSSKGNRPGYVYNEKDWNPTTYEEATRKDSPGFVSYLAAKSFAEKAAWDFVRDRKPHFDLVAILPPWIFGPNKNATANLAKLNMSSTDIYKQMSPTCKPTDPVPVNSFWSCVDVRDVAQAHVRAFEVPEAGGQRFFVCMGNYSNQQVVDILREKIPELRDRVPVGKPGSGFGGVELYTPDMSKSIRVLGLKYRDLDQTIVDAARSFLELERKGRS